MYLRFRQNPSFTHVLTQLLLDSKEEESTMRIWIFINPWPRFLPTDSRRGNISSQVSLCFVAQSLGSFMSLIMYQVGTGASQASRRSSFTPSLTCSTTERDPSSTFSSLLVFPDDLPGLQCTVQILGPFFAQIIPSLVTGAIP